MSLFASSVLIMFSFLFSFGSKLFSCSVKSTEMLGCKYKDDLKCSSREVCWIEAKHDQIGQDRVERSGLEQTRTKITKQSHMVASWLLFSSLVYI